MKSINNIPIVINNWNNSLNHLPEFGKLCLIYDENDGSIQTAKLKMSEPEDYRDEYGFLQHIEGGEWFVYEDNSDIGWGTTFSSENLIYWVYLTPNNPKRKSEEGEVIGK